MKKNNFAWHLRSAGAKARSEADLGRHRLADARGETILLPMEVIFKMSKSNNIIHAYIYMSYIKKMYTKDKKTSYAYICI